MKNKKQNINRDEFIDKDIDGITIPDNDATKSKKINLEGIDWNDLPYGGGNCYDYEFPTDDLI